MSEQSNLERFVEAQNDCYETVCAELAAGKKKTHWMWFVFPQLEGLGQSTMTRKFALQSKEKAIEYLNHPILGARLTQCVGLMLSVKGKSAFEILGTPDDLKFKSCMTLFAAVALGDSVFKEALLRFFGDKADPRTLELLARK
ncbi:MAG: DUF1810 domain-containing protein [Pseudomonadota bacterium]